MAAGLPYAIGAAVAFPRRQVVVFTGDGSLTMQLGDLLTAVQHQLPIKIVVIKNDSLGLIKWEQMVFLENPEFGVDMAPMDFVKFADAAGARGLRIEDPRLCAKQMQESLSWDGPAIVECVVDPHSRSALVASPALALCTASSLALSSFSTAIWLQTATTTRLAEM